MTPPACRAIAHCNNTGGLQQADLALTTHPHPQRGTTGNFSTANPSQDQNQPRPISSSTQDWSCLLLIQLKSTEFRKIHSSGLNLARSRGTPSSFAAYLFSPPENINISTAPTNPQPDFATEQQSSHVFFLGCITRCPETSSTPRPLEEKNIPHLSPARSPHEGAAERAKWVSLSAGGRYGGSMISRHVSRKSMSQRHRQLCAYLLLS